MIGAVPGFKRLVQALNKLGIPFMVAGSVASSIRGVVRTTMDVDLVVALEPYHVPLLVAEIGKEFYIEPDMVQEALRRHRAFNVIHFESAYKFDIYPLGEDAYEQVQFERRTMEDVSAIGNEIIEAPVASAEDTVLNKLAWYRAGGETSERQWNDVRGVVTVRRAELDLQYLRRWARYLTIEDLLEQALTQAGLAH